MIHRVSLFAFSLHKYFLIMKGEKKILIVDDEPDVLELLAYNFQINGFDVLLAKDGEDAFQKLEATKPDVILSDIMMPNMNGVDFCRKLKEDKELKNIPVVFLSAADDDYVTLSAMSAGGEDYISKPVRMKLLIEKINKRLVS